VPLTDSLMSIFPGEVFMTLLSDVPSASGQLLNLFRTPTSPPFGQRRSSKALSLVMTNFMMFLVTMSAVGWAFWSVCSVLGS
jgi:hypothetical protein